MAILKDIELTNGLSVKRAYLRIVYFSWTENNIEFSVNAYVDNLAFIEGKTPITSLNYNTVFDKDKFLFGQMYDYLMELPEFKGAEKA
ncbi:hypothetical protein ACI2JA_04200 [Alkalihalobacillus sp. NPDC078783]